ncbi:hypothetical protein [Anditalea andensis]|uniref:Uncharacterized protein n=1 Tax=Anditalea andensis TaxID=1048983 RepID=A0A074LID0_9BACT|nr:hypothetical protein [Anditalea andensis]KEO73532.1 hypothetical protein EL17_11560 [Anditalea andensis]
MWENWDENEWDESDEAEFLRKKANTPPLMWKCIDIVKLTRAIVGSLDEARTELYGSSMIQSAKILAIKYIEANAHPNYIIKMENAVVMKINARMLYDMTLQLALESTHAEEHLQLLRDAIGELKKLFVDWVKTFNKNQRSDDGWGLFVD